MLGFATVQYFAICRPLHHLYVLRRRKVVVFLALTWTVSLIGGFVPLTILALIVRAEDCAAWLLRLKNFKDIQGQRQKDNGDADALSRSWALKIQGHFQGDGQRCRSCFIQIFKDIQGHEQLWIQGHFQGQGERWRVVASSYLDRRTSRSQRRCCVPRPCSHHHRGPVRVDLHPHECHPRRDDALPVCAWHAHWTSHWCDYQRPSVDLECFLRAVCRAPGSVSQEALRSRSSETKQRKTEDQMDW